MPTVAELNDKHRKWIPLTSTVITSGVDRLGADVVDKIISKVRSFNAFEEGNDPYGEHDFWAIEHAWEKIYWKIDYYSKDWRGWGEDPSDVDKTKRILTIMLSDEY